MKIIKPESFDQIEIAPVSVFLAGSIEMGTAENWQTTIEHTLADIEGTLYNPRRDNWNDQWKQTQNFGIFNYQVNWELNKLEEADLIFMYFDPKTKSPISLLELGLHIGPKVIVCCPDGFWRKGNIEIVCTRNGVPVYNTLIDAIGALITKISQKSRLRTSK